MTNDARKWLTFVRRELFWLATKIIPLVVFQILVEITFRAGWLAFFGPEDVQLLVHDIFTKILLTLYVLFFFALFTRYVVPTVTMTLSPAVDKLVRQPWAKQRTITSIRRSMTYLGYLLAAIGVINIWAYSLVGVWLVGFLGTTGVIILTFVVGLFTSSVLGNLLAFWVLNNSLEFKTGDRVQIGETYGDVVELSMFFTRVKTIKDEIISLPNLMVMGKEVKNFSALPAVLLHVPLTLGYHVDKTEATRLLIQCAAETPGILTTEDRKPFVLFTDLGKYTVTYEINAYTDQPNALVSIKSALIDKILSACQESKIELLSPTYIALREESEH